MLNETLKVTGAVQITVFDQITGEVKDTREIKNLVVTAGKTFIAAAMLKTTTNSPAAMTHMELGTGTTAAAVGDTALQTAIAGSRTALSSATSAANVVTYVSSFGAGTGTGAVTEAGIFNAASAGTMLCRTVFSVVNKGANDAMSITWQITVS
jgi:hypothetical protein